MSILTPWAKMFAGTSLHGLLAAALLMPVIAATPAMAQPVPPVSLEGVWKIVTPGTMLKPFSGAVPFTHAGREHYDANRRLKARRAYDDYDIARSRCSTPGVPRLMLTAKRFKIWQRLGFVTFDFEWNRAIRQIDVRGVKTEPMLVPNMAGTSKGHWEGDTLVAETSDFLGRTLIDDLVPHSENMKVTERLRLIAPDTLEDRVTITDPAYFTRPWEAVLTYARQPDAFFPEDVCLDRIEAHEPAFGAP